MSAFVKYSVTSLAKLQIDVKFTLRFAAQNYSEIPVTIYMQTVWKILF